MHLLVFAHKAEAQAFFENEKYTIEKIAGQDYYVSNHHFLFFCQEGASELTALTLLLGRIYHKVEAIINLGVAGALSSSLNLGQLISVRTIYGEKETQQTNTKLHKQSFTSANETGLDLVTAQSRVLSTNYKQELAHFGQLVDREAYAIAKVAKLVEKPFYCYKIISDFANETVDQIEIQKKSLEHSRLLLAGISELLELSPKNYKKVQVDLPQGLHFSAAQEKLYVQYLKKLQNKLNKQPEEILKLAELPLIKQSKLRPKVQSRALLENLQFLLNPKLKALDENLKALTANFNKKSQQISFHPQFENDTIQINAQIRNHDDWQFFLRTSQELNYKRIQSLLNGDL